MGPPSAVNKQYTNKYCDNVAIAVTRNFVLDFMFNRIREEFINTDMVYTLVKIKNFPKFFKYSKKTIYFVNVIRISVQWGPPSVVNKQYTNQYCNNVLAVTRNFVLDYMFNRIREEFMNTDMV